MNLPRYMIEMRNRVLKSNLTGLERRYATDGDREWGPWLVLDRVADASKLECKLKFWQDLNADAVRARGSEALTEFRSVDTYSTTAEKAS